MKKFNGYDDAKKQAESVGAPKLPEGAYVCKLLDVKYEEADQEGRSDRIIIRFDIAEGEHKDFFQKQYENNTSEDKKWKGVVRVYVPKDDGTKEDGWTKRTLASWTLALEKSNPGYEWDWDESKWKNKIVGIVFGRTGTVINGRNIVYTEARFPIEAEKVRDGSAPQADFKAKNGYKEESKPQVDSEGFMSIPEDAEEEIPF